jgi:hypothetical protein
MAVLIPKYFGENIDPKRRRFLIAALEAGVLGLGSSAAAEAAVFGIRPRKLKSGRSVYSLTGTANLNGAPLSTASVIRPGDTVETGANSRLIFAVADNAYILRQDSQMILPADNDVAGALRLVTGGLLSVFGRRKRSLVTSAVTIGIRGTGVYLESTPDESYVCTCFGTADLIPTSSGQIEETVQTEHHDAPRYAVVGASSGKSVREAPFKNHTDMEVALIEALVGRSAPIQFTLDQFDSPLNSY